ncbi:MAG: PTS sugar transporter subunit IIA [Spirochaetaceae bacterium]|jgi:PTS system nitrogen regulatory IIA component|nr:PTS sugar transporter subunit IIA [Spirochaetaceae bacterium]
MIDSEFNDNRLLTLEDVAKYLRLPAKTVEEWAENGEIPSGRFGNELRFKKQEIEAWVDSRFSFPVKPPEFQREHLKSILAEDRIIFIEQTKKHDALLELAENLAVAPQVKNRDEFIKGILSREELMSTAIGKGIAIPHIRLASVTSLVVSVGISRSFFDGFVALDDEPVRLLFMIAAASTQHAYYLQALSYFSRLLKNDKLRGALFSAETCREVYDIICA